jgi:hypothetical protein
MIRFQRRKTFVDSHVQGALARRIVLHWTCLLAVASVTAFTLQVLVNPFRPFVNHVADLWWTQGPILLVAVLLLPLFVIDIVKISHHFAGPILSLRRAMRDIAQAKPSKRLNLRADDFWKELADDFNVFVVRAGVVQQDSPPTVHEQDKTIADKPLVGTRN